jgi:hypothetical protein
MQAVRLVAEIMATQDNLDMEALCVSMDISMDELNSLINRIDNEWEFIKKNTCKAIDINEKDAKVKV